MEAPGEPMASEPQTPNMADPKEQSTNAPSKEPTPNRPQDVLGYRPEHENDLPGRRCTATLTAPPAGIRLGPKEYIQALKEHGLNIDEDIACIQRESTNQVHITFRDKGKQEHFISQRTMETNGLTLSTMDSNQSVVWVTIEDAPFELPDSAIIHRLKEYGRTMSHKFGKFKEHPSVSNGLRHYRMKIVKPIPSYLRIGSFTIQLKYEGQAKTCRKCNDTDHFSRSCAKIVCFNCDEIGHIASVCPHERLCSICRATDHLAYSCSLSWEWYEDGSEAGSDDSTEDTLHEVDDFLTGQRDSYQPEYNGEQNVEYVTYNTNSGTVNLETPLIKPSAMADKDTNQVKEQAQVPDKPIQTKYQEQKQPEPQPQREKRPEKDRTQQATIVNTAETANSNKYFPKVSESKNHTDTSQMASNEEKKIENKETKIKNNTEKITNDGKDEAGSNNMDTYAEKIRNKRPPSTSASGTDSQGYMHYTKLSKGNAKKKKKSK